MFDTNGLIERLRTFGVGRRALADELFAADGAPATVGLRDQHEDPADLADPVAAGGYRCGVCRRALPSPHLLDLHVQETHDSFFAAVAARRPAYSCYVQECTEKFVNAETRFEHCVQVHRLPKDFRFEMKPKSTSKPKESKLQSATPSMEVDGAPSAGHEPRKLSFHNSKQKGFIRYSGRKFTSDEMNKSSGAANMDQVMLDLRHSLPD